MTINKSLLSNLPGGEKPVDVTVRSIADLEQSNKELQSQIDALTAQIAFVATFEQTLLTAFEKEIKLLQECSSVSQNEQQKRVFSMLGASMNRLRQRWCDKTEFHVNKKTMSIDAL